MQGLSKELVIAYCNDCEEGDMIDLAGRLGAMLKAERLRQGLSQGEMARRMACAISFVQGIEYGKVSRRIDTYERYANALGKELTAAFENGECPSEVRDGGAGLD
jgi:transcriptional regulator with XRE-family HTH domain